MPNCAMAPQSAAQTPPPVNFIHPDHMPDLYALTGVGTCMEPLIPDGQVVVFDKRERPVRGDCVGIIFTREAAARRHQSGMIKRLVLSLPPALGEGFDTLIVVEQINPPRQYCLSSKDVLAVHKLVGKAVSMGNGMAAYAPHQPGEA